MQKDDAKRIDLTNKVSDSIAKYAMLKPKEAVLAAVSGGADSVAMLHVLARLSIETEWRLAVAHFNHCLRGAESDRDARFVSRLSERLKLSMFQGKANVDAYAKEKGLSLEEAARILRYAFLNKTAQKQGFDKIALGHNKNDSAETVLIYLLRGSGPRGLAGISPVRNNVVRPLIEIERKEIEKFLTNEKIHYVFDSSNADTRFIRNRVRNGLMPLLENEYNREIVDALNRTAVIVRDEQDWLDNVLENVYNKVKVAGETHNLAFSIQELQKLHLAVARRIVRRAVAEVKGNLRRIEHRHVEAVVQLIKGNRENRMLDFPGPVRVERRDENLIFIRRKSSARPAKQDRSEEREKDGFEYVVARPGTVLIGETGAMVRISETDPPAIDDSGRFENPTETKRCAYVDADLVSFPVKVRSFRPGDRFAPLGLFGRKKLKKFFIDNKIPRADKRRVPILESQGRIVWVAGYRLDDNFKISKTTRKALKVELLVP